jgi:hypothetical protein
LHLVGILFPRFMIMIMFVLTNVPKKVKKQLYGRGRPLRVPRG